MESIVNIYNDLRKKDKKKIEGIPLENRIIISQLITNSPADSALRYAWVNRALAQSDKKESSAILSLGENAPKEQIYARKVSKKIREKNGLTNPIELFSKDDFKKFMEDKQVENIVIKQNYPSESEEMIRFNQMNSANYSFQIANTKEAYNVIESKKCLASISQKNKDWLSKNITEYIEYIINKNNIQMSINDLSENCELMTNLVSTFLIKTKIYKGEIKGLYDLVLELLKDNFWPVFKFNYSVSGYGVHYPKMANGQYDLEELKNKLKDEETFIQYLTDMLNKNGQKVSKDELMDNIKNYGITLQKYIYGHEHSIGYFKPLKNVADNFSLALTDFIVTDVIVEGTAHCGNILHYDEKYIFEILEKTKFKDKANLLHFSVEIILYLMYLNEGIINSPEEYQNVCVEDFGIQFIVNDESGDVGIIEFNGRTPSCNFNHYYLLSKYGIGFEEKNILPTKKVMFTNAKIIDSSKFCNIIENDYEEKFINSLLEKTNEIFKNKLEIVSIQVFENDVTMNFAYYLDIHENPSKELANIKNMLLTIFNREEQEWIL